MKVFLYVQHLLGIGHLKRAAVLAAALGRAGMKVCVASGGLPVAGFFPAGARVVQLPPASARDASFALMDEHGRPVDDAWREKRSSALLQAFRESEADALVVELFPFGRRQMRFELIPLLEAARASRTLAACSVRDLIQPKPAREAAIVELVARFFDLVLVHGDPVFAGFERTFSAAARLGDKLRYTGYVVEPARNASSAAGRGEVIVSAGGGAVGGRLLETAIAARASSALGGRTWRVLAGAHGQPPPAPGGVVVEKTREDFPALLANCEVSVSQAGYNTVMETLQARARGASAVCRRRRGRAKPARAAARGSRAGRGGGGSGPLAGNARRGGRSRACAFTPPSRDRHGRRPAQRRASAGARAMSPAWQAFSDAVARRAGAGRAPVFWWRDDDATMPTPALQRLLELSYSSSVPLALAVVPEGAQPALFALLWGEVAVVQHGTDHRNRAAAGEKKTEFPAAERDDEALGRIARAREHLAALAGPRALPVLAPPWNRLRPALAGKLPLAGIHGLSAYGEKTVIAKGVTQVNTHVDIVAWREGKRFLGEDAALALARGRLERDEPLGWLTHHALHEADALDFLKRLFETSRRAGARWASARELWP